MSEENEISAEHGQTKLRIRGYDALTIAVISGMAIMSAIFYRHQDETAVNNAAILVTLRDQQTTLSAFLREQRFATCVNATKPEEREAQYANPSSFCNRIAK